MRLVLDGQCWVALASAECTARPAAELLVLNDSDGANRSGNRGLGFAAVGHRARLVFVRVGVGLCRCVSGLVIRFECSFVLKCVVCVCVCVLVRVCLCDCVCRSFCVY